MAEYTENSGQEVDGDMDPIGAAAGQAYAEALQGGATPQEAFDAAAGAAQEVATEMGVPQDEFDAGLDAASTAFGEAMDSGAGPGEAFGSAMQAANEATDPGIDMAAPEGDLTGDTSSCSGDMTGVTGDCTGCSGDMTGVTGDVSGATGDMTGCTGDMSGVTGDCTGCSGVMNDVTGDVSEVTGDMTGVAGDCTGFSGDMTGVDGPPPADMMDQGMGAMDQAFGDPAGGMSSDTSPPTTDDTVASLVDGSDAASAATNAPEGGHTTPEIDPAAGAETVTEEVITDDTTTDDSVTG